MVGEYQVTGIIGEGGMGTVYAGIQPLIGKKVAVKMLKKALSDDPSAMERFLAEARAVNRIGHPNIVDVFSFGMHEDSQYFVMEHLEGRDLATYLEEHRPVSYAEAAHIVGEILDALEAAHQHQIVHRDLKPDNIFLVDRPGGGLSVKLLDFGIAKFTDDGGMSGHTRTGVPMGTPLYMSPEQCRGRDIDHRTDIYSIGVILYQMFTGSPPFIADSFYEVISAHLTTLPPPPSRLASIPAELEAVILACLEKDAGRRPGTVAALREQLIPILQQLAGHQAAPVITPGAVQQPALTPQPSVSGSLSVGTDSVPPGGPGLAAAAAPTAGSSRTGLLVAAVVGALVVVGGGIGAWVLLTGEPPPPVVAPPLDAAPVAVAPPVDATPERVIIQLMLNPPVTGAEIYVDGRRIQKPEIEVPKSRSRQLEIKVLAEGYEPFVARARPVSDLAFPINLVKKSAAVERGRRRGSRGGTSDQRPRPRPSRLKVFNKL